MKNTLVFWSWNYELDKEKLKVSIDEMKNVGIGGFFMHARAGLTSRYFSDEWFDAIRFCAEYAYSLDMDAYLYDENGWPSGSHGGIVSKNNASFSQMYIEKEPASRRHEYSKEDIVSSDKESIYVIKKNTQYTDLLNPLAVRSFLDCAYEGYKSAVGDLFGREIKGIFTDEPQLSGRGLPYTHSLFDEFESKYGYSLKESLSKLFLEGKSRIKYDYHALLADMYENAYSKQIGEWCEQNNLIFTGHMAAEDGLYSQSQTQVSVMQNYLNYGMPGIDFLGRRLAPITLLKQAGSVAEQTGKRLISETFGTSGHSVKPWELVEIQLYQALFGVNVSCMHLSHISMLGRRKRDYPPSFSYHLNYFFEAKCLFEALDTINTFASGGKRVCNILLISPIGAFFEEYTPKKENDVEGYKNWLYELGISENLSRVTTNYRMLQENLLSCGYDFHIGDPRVMERMAHVEGNTLSVGECSYDTIIIPDGCVLDGGTEQMLEEYAKSNGRLLLVGSRPCSVGGGLAFSEEVSNMLLPLTLRKSLMEMQLKAYKIAHTVQVKYLHSTTNVDNLQISVKHDENKKYIFIKNYNRTDLPCQITLDGKTYCFELYAQRGAILIYDACLTVYIPAEQKTYVAKEIAEDKKTTKMPLSLCAEALDKNILVIDKCKIIGKDTSFPEEYTNRANENFATLKGRVRAVYSFEASGSVKNIECVVESNSKLEEIICNGMPLGSSCGWFYDRDFLKYDLSKHIRDGHNFIELVYNTHEEATEPDGFESEKNIFFREVEIENIFILGDFRIECQAEKKYKGEDRYLSVSSEKIIPASDNSYSSQSHPFYRGRVKYTASFGGEAAKNVMLTLDTSHPLCQVRVNGNFVGTLMGGAADISKYVVQGENTLEIIAYTTDRNLMGPHHYYALDCDVTGPDTYAGAFGWEDGFNRCDLPPNVPRNTYAEHKNVLCEYIEHAYIVYTE